MAFKLCLHLFFSFLIVLLGKKVIILSCDFFFSWWSGCCCFLIINRTLQLELVVICKRGYHLSIEIKQFHWECSNFLSNYDKQGPKFGTGPKFAEWDSH